MRDVEHARIVVAAATAGHRDRLGVDHIARLLRNAGGQVVVPGPEPGRWCRLQRHAHDARRRVRLLPREQDRLLLFLAAELARRRRARGLALGQAEAVAVIADTVCEAARDGAAYAEAALAGYAALGPADVQDGVAGLVPRVEVEALFADGSRLVVLHDPIARDGPPPAGEAPLEWTAEGVAVTVVNEGAVPVGVTSHFHFFEVNRTLRFDRAAAWGKRLAVAAGVKVFFDPGVPRDVWLVPFGGARVIRGHGGLVDGPLDAEGAMPAALALARERGYRGA